MLLDFLVGGDQGRQSVCLIAQGCLISVAVSSSSVLPVSLGLSEVKMMVGLSTVTTTLDSHLVADDPGALGAPLRALLATLLRMPQRPEG